MLLTIQGRSAAAKHFNSKFNMAGGLSDLSCAKIKRRKRGLCLLYLSDLTVKVSKVPFYKNSAEALRGCTR